MLEAPKRFVSSKRFVQLLPWVSALILLIGVGAFLGKHYSNTAKVDSSKPSAPAVPAPVLQKNIKFPPAAWRVAREFLFTALPRKNLARSYAITAPSAHAGYTLKQWETGTLPNIPYFPTAQVLRYNWKNTNYAHPRDAQINVILVPSKASHQKAVSAQIALRKVGQGSNAHWLVDYFSPISGPGPIPHP